MSSVSDFCLDPNPDIAGIGVRFAIYFQAFVTVIPLGLFVLDGKLDERERKILRSVFLNLLLTSTALLICTFVLMGRNEVSKYHLFIILDLSWVNTITSLGHVGAQFLAMQEEGGQLSSYISSGKDWFTIAFSCLHMSLTAALGIWTWIIVGPHGSGLGCPATVYSILGYTIPATSNTLRIVSLAVYSIIAFPGFNIMIALFVLLFPFSILLLRSLLLLLVLVEGFLRLLFAPFNRATGHGFSESTVAKQLNSMKSVIKSPSSTPFTSILFVLAWQIIFVADVELIVKRNHRVVGHLENRWSFGQNLAILLLVLPISETIKQGIEWYKDRKRPNDNIGNSPTHSKANLAPLAGRKDEESHGIHRKSDTSKRTEKAFK